MAEAAVSFTVERLGELLITEAKFLYGVKSQVDDIRAELRKMQCYLQDADAKQYENQTIRDWVREIRALSHKTEDVIETFAAKVASKRRGAIKTAVRRISRLFRDGMALHEIGLELAAIKNRMAELTTSLQTCEQIKALREGESSNSAELQPVRMSYSHLTQMDFVGMEDEITNIVSLLKNKEKGCEIVSVWGMAGQGKTTLVSKICFHADIQSSFKAFALVCISQRFQKKKVLQDILVKLLPRKKTQVMTMGDRELVQMLRRTLEENNCLVVLDDIWTVSAWKSLQPAFPVGNQASGSKIVLTTRLSQVAEGVGSPYKLRSLSDEEAWKLFLNKVFLDKGDDIPEDRHKERENIGREMVRKCEGLPLAISMLGGILEGKTTLKDWEMLNKDVDSYISKGKGVEKECNVVTQVVALSYDKLSYRLKQLLLFFGNFSEDGEIWVVPLCFMWIADGLIFSDDRAQGETMMNVTERYLGELAQRSLVQVEPATEGGSYSTFRSCRVHGLIRELCLLKGKDEHLVNVIDSRDGNDPTLPHSNSSAEINVAQSRRLAIHLYDGTDTKLFVPLKQQNVIRQLRSLIFYNPNRLPLIVDNLGEFKLLRLLHLHNFDFNDNGNSLGGIGELTYLRYLSLSGSMLDELPTSIGNLRLLQSLDLSVRGEISIPDHNMLRMMKQLKRLYLPYSIRLKDTSKKLRLDGLRELEIISYFNAGTCDVNDLVKLTGVRVLHEMMVNILEDIAKTINFITSSGLHHKQYLSLWCINIPNFGSEEGLSCLIQLLECVALSRLMIKGNVGILPKHCDQPRRFSQSLTFIQLWRCEFEEDPMQLLENVPNLQVLGLFSNSFIGREMVCAATGFPRLIRLQFSVLSNLETWKVDEGAMPNLSWLRIWGCYQLKMLPDGLRFLNSLRQLDLQDTPQVFKNRIKVINGIEGVDFDKVRHVPSIML